MRTRTKSRKRYKEHTKTSQRRNIFGFPHKREREGKVESLRLFVPKPSRIVMLSLTAIRRNQGNATSRMMFLRLLQVMLVRSLGTNCSF